MNKGPNKTVNNTLNRAFNKKGASIAGKKINAYSSPDAGIPSFRDINAAMQGAAQTGTLTPSVNKWSFDPYAVE